MNELNKNDVIEIFKAIHANVSTNRDYLIKLDSELGDGDLGLTMEAGFCKICETVDSLRDEKDLGVFIKKLGFAMAGAVPSTMGTLMASAIMKSGEAVAGKEVITAEDLPQMALFGIAGMERRAKGRRGDKTILDALYPAYEAMDKAVKENKSMNEVLQAGYEGAKKGLEETKLMKSALGKAAVFGDKTVGKQDPGATVAVIVYEAITGYVK